MKSLQEIVDLITIRNYAANSVNNHSLKRDVTNQLNTTVILLDKILVEQLVSEEFKSLVHFENASEIIKDVVKHTSLKGNMNPSNVVVTIENGKPELK